ncbi:pyrroline-5-carboxylate reductase [Propionibacteriaceae bacterium G1746]|uniref:pyrroline-5-carboxylate reductase n=1 Tax=Aestuariimicrobium sp. G57 TaxID=3418485 RepID=UPI003C1FB5EF
MSEPQAGAGFGRIAVIGAGNMGGAILHGLIKAGTNPSDVVAAEPSAARREALEADLGIGTTADAAEAVEGADVVLVAVKPQYVVEVLTGLPIRDGALLVSIAAGVTIATLEAAVPQAHVVRVMPNTAALVGEGMAGLSAGSSATADDLGTATALLSTVGRAVVVPESQQDLVVAASGSGIAYLFLVAEAMIEGGVTLGLTRAQADELVRQTFAGASAMLANGEHPTILREQVTSPGGTTAAALAELDAHGLRTAILAAMTAARDKSRALG